MEIGCLGIPSSPDVPITLDHPERVMHKLDPPSLLLVRGHVCPFAHVEAMRYWTAGSLNPRQTLQCAIKVPPRGNPPKSALYLGALLISGKRGIPSGSALGGHCDDRLEYGDSVLQYIQYSALKIS